MQYQYLSILQKGKIPSFRYKQQQSRLHIYANERTNKGCYIFSLFFSIDIFHFPTAVGTEGLFIAKVENMSY